MMSPQKFSSCSNFCTDIRKKNGIFMLGVVFLFRSISGHRNNSFLTKQIIPYWRYRFPEFKCSAYKSQNAPLRGQTVNWLGAYYCVCMFLDSRDKSFNMLKFCRNDQRKWKNKRRTKGASLLWNSLTMHKMYRPQNVRPHSVHQLLLHYLTFNSTTVLKLNKTRICTKTQSKWEINHSLFTNSIFLNYIPRYFALFALDYQRTEIAACFIGSVSSKQTLILRWIEVQEIDIYFCSDIRYESNRISVIGVGFFFFSQI